MLKYNSFTINGEYFDAKSTLECGQIFRYKPFNKGYLVFSCDKCAYVYNENHNLIIECLSEDRDYFYNFFDVERDYSKIYQSAIQENISVLTKAVEVSKGIRILNQDKTETLFSFIISQNNNIPRIKGIIEKLCESLGEKKSFMGEEYYAFPTVIKMAEKDYEFYESLSLGYRAKYIKNLADKIANGYDVKSLLDYETDAIKKSLLSLTGVGPKVADCVLLFGFHKSNSFPVDTWIEKVYKEDLNGKLKDRAKISQYLVERFKENSGYYQQYLFYYKRLNEKKR